MRPAAARENTRIGHLRQLVDAQPRRVPTLTLDNGTEFNSYKKLEAVVDTRCTFATPHQFWERGSDT